MAALANPDRADFLVYSSARRMFFSTPSGPSLYRWASPQYPLGLPRSAAFWKSCSASGYFLWDMANTALARKRSALMNS